MSSTSGGVGEGREGVVEHFKPLSRPFSPLSPPWLTPLMGPGCRQERGFASFRSKIDCKCSPNFGLLKGVKAMVIVLENKSCSRPLSDGSYKDEETLLYDNNFFL